MKPSTKPQCPNHFEPLEGIGFPIPAKGVGKCPVSGVDFEFEASTDPVQVVKDKAGNITKKPTWEVTGNE